MKLLYAACSILGGFIGGVIAVLMVVWIEEYR